MIRQPARTISDSSTPSFPRTVGSIGLVLGAVIFSTLALRSIIQPGPWLTQTLTHLALLAGVVLVARLITHRVASRTTSLLTSVLPSMVGFLFAAWLLLASFGKSTPDGDFAPLISSAHFKRIGWLLIEARRLSLESIAPIDAPTSITLVIVGALSAVFILADLIANGLRMPALTAITIIPVWLPPLMLVTHVPIRPMFGVWLCLLLLLVVDNPFRTEPRFPAPGDDSLLASPGAWIRSRTPVTSRVAASLVATALCAALVVALSPQLPIWQRITAPSLKGTLMGQLQIADTLDLRSSLGPRANDVVFRYRTDDPDAPPAPLRSTTLTDFDGQIWRPSTDGSGSTRMWPGQLLWPHEGPDLSTATEMTTLLTVEALKDVSLPIPMEPRAVLTEQGGTYFHTRDALELDQATQSGEIYTIRSFDRGITPEDLKESAIPDSRENNPGILDTHSPDHLGTSILPALALPESEHISKTVDLAHVLTESAGDSDYDKVLALQNYLRDPDEFTYALDLPQRRTNDAVWDFLTDRTGYCVQFATAMTLMVRALGLPARVGVGFLPGDLNADGEYVVTGRNAHAWTEVYFNGVGWVRFEPTPAIQSGITPAWAPADEEVGPTPTPTPTPTKAQPSATPSPKTTAPKESKSAVADDDLPNEPTTTSPMRFVVLGIGSTIVVVAALAVWLLRRKQRGQVLVEAAWTSVVDRARRLGIDVADSATLRQIAAKIEPDGTGGVHDLAAALESARYSPQAPQLSVEQITELREAAHASVRTHRQRSTHAGTDS